MWRTVTASGQTVRPVVIALCLFGMFGAWADIPERWRLPTVVAAVVLCAVPLSYWLVDLLALAVPIWRRQEADAAPEADPPADAVMGIEFLTSEMLAFLTQVRAHNTSLRPHEQDNSRIWTWHDLGMSARRWVELTDVLVAAGVCLKADDGTWAVVQNSITPEEPDGIPLTIVELFRDIFVGRTPLPQPKGEEEGNKGTRNGVGTGRQGA